MLRCCRRERVSVPVEVGSRDESHGESVGHHASNLVVNDDNSSTKELYSIGLFDGRVLLVRRVTAGDDSRMHPCL